MEAVPALRTPLERARSEFVAAMAGLIEVDHNGPAQARPARRSLRELWHLRSELYTLIARRVGQPEADARLARVNQHFPTRAQRTSTPVRRPPMSTNPRIDLLGLSKLDSAAAGGADELRFFPTTSRCLPRVPPASRRAVPSSR